MTRAELRARVLDALNDSGGVLFPSVQANRVLDEAMEVLSEETAAIQRTVFLPQQPATTYYWLSALGSDVMAPVRIVDVDRDYRLRAVGMSELDAIHETWPTVRRDPEVWFPVSWDLFGVWPCSPTGGDILRVDYLAWPRGLLDDTDEPEFQASDAEALVDYAIAEGFLRRWEAMPAVEAWARFVARTSGSKQRAGIGRVQARSFQLGRADTDPGFVTGIER